MLWWYISKYKLMLGTEKYTKHKISKLKLLQRHLILSHQNIGTLGKLANISTDGAQNLLL